MRKFGGRKVQKTKPSPMSACRTKTGEEAAIDKMALFLAGMMTQSMLKGNHLSDEQQIKCIVIAAESFGLVGYQRHQEGSACDKAKVIFQRIGVRMKEWLANDDDDVENEDEEVSQ
jgi:hypothetical protein